MNKWYHSLLDTLTDSNTWEDLGITAIRIVLIIAISKMIMWILHKSLDRIVLERASKHPPSQARRMTTVGKLVKNVVTYIMYFIVFMLLLSEVGINLGPLLAGAGVVGIAIGFGAQSLVKDILTGFFIILEDQFAVGDVIQTGTFKGTVEVIGLRTTKILSWTGEVHMVPNGMINEVTNFSVNNTLAVVDVLVAYEAQVDKAMSIISDTMNQLEHENLVNKPEVLGVQLMSATSVTIRVTGECKPNTHHMVARAMNKAIKDALDRNGIEVPYPRMVTYQRTYEEG
ncbi:mechanosensitive ion channel family protein [Paenibacillus sp. 1011MAR3C5]|uniref:mechanosensitive ion channel family protein n=1 Tax=Paenibacillus sp. 1011MAR3C5 TaxID=1675787 RepID=UPI000E6CA3C7|nr:mechanosensitive ion channel family protein [Paenibacillus sp. 1011MAR3C5]RJE83304.1 mechanosensitive ion channel family protein [Paenibacillus sp. 1011MAR3C5]